jgi:hypothetical protein
MTGLRRSFGKRHKEACNNPNKVKITKTRSKHNLDKWNLKTRFNCWLF